jgi:hypothetical protein
MVGTRWRCYALLVILSVCSACSGPNSRVAGAPDEVATEVLPAYSADTIVASGVREPSALGPGMIAEIYGEGLGPAKPCTGEPDPQSRETPNPLRPNQTLIELQVFPKELCGTEVRVGGASAGLLYVSAGQINFKVPQETSPAGAVDVQVTRSGKSGPRVSLSVREPEATYPSQHLAETMLAGLKAVPWERTFREKDCSPVAPHPNLRGGLYGHARYCAQHEAGVVAETFYYPVDAAAPELVLRRADFRLENGYPEMSAEVEQLLTERLSRAYGPGVVPEQIMEIGAYGRNPGLSWKAGETTIFLHRNRNHVTPAGVREGVLLIAVRRELLEEQQEIQRIEEAFQNTAKLAHPVIAGELEKELDELYIPPEKRPETEPERIKPERAVRTGLLRLLRETDQGDRSRRAAMLVAADDLSVRLGGLLMSRDPSFGEVPGSDRIRRQLASFGVRYTGPGHYSGELESDRSLLIRAWRQYPETPWGQRAFLMLQGIGCAVPEFGCDGPNCFLTVIQQGEKFLQEYPDTPLRKEQLYYLGLANDTWWSLSRAEPGDISAEGAKVDRVSGERARLRAIGYYEQLLQLAPGSAEPSAGRLALPRLRLGLATGERRFFCFSC